MESPLSKAVAALALAGTAAPAAAQPAPPPPAATESPEGAGLWIGVLTALVVAGVAIWHDELFDDDEPDLPVSP